jgi:hypothetical protein
MEHATRRAHIDPAGIAFAPGGTEEDAVPAGRRRQLYINLRLLRKCVVHPYALRLAD